MNNRRHFPLVPAIAVLMLLSAGSASAQVTVENLTEKLQWRNIGPSNMSGRITDIDALEDDYRFVVVASASGGVWKSTNAGTTWDPIFDDYGTASIGAVSIFQPDPGRQCAGGWIEFSPAPPPSSRTWVSW